MSDLAALLETPFLQRLGWALLSSLWQGALVAALLASADLIFRRVEYSSRLRYNLSCGALVLMLALPVGTLCSRAPFSLEQSARAVIPSRTLEGIARPTSEDLATRPSPAPNLRFAPLSHRSFQAVQPWLVAVWIAGVLVLSGRYLTGWAAARRLCRQKALPASERWEQALARLAGLLKVSRPVRLLESTAVAVPTAIGAFRSVILFPASALSGLPSEQIEAILAHELAHIRRYDYLVNLFQTAAETLLFYHPAVWWVSRRIRTERENCCDDLAVAATGDARSYARALLELEEIRSEVLQPALAATGGKLWNRVSRLFRAPSPLPDQASRWLAGALALCALVTLGAAAKTSSLGFPEAETTRPSGSVSTTPADLGTARASVRTPAGKPGEGIPGGVPGVSGGVPGGIVGGVPSSLAGGVGGGVRGGIERGVENGVDCETVEEAERDSPEEAETDAEEDPAEEKRSERLSAQQLTEFRNHGVTPEFIRQIRERGYSRATPEALVALRIHGVTPEYISRMTQVFGRQTLEQWTSFRIHGVTAEFVDNFRRAGYEELTADDAVSLRIHGVQPSDAAVWERLGFSRPTLEELLSARIHGVGAQEVRSMRALGFENASLDDLVSFRIHGVTPDFIRAMRSAGGFSLSADAALGLRIHGVTEEFVREIRSLGYTKVTADEMTALRIHGVTPGYIRRVNRSAGERLSIDDLLTRRIQEREEDDHDD